MGKKVLLIEDDTDQRVIYKLLLETELPGCCVIEARDAEEGLAMIITERPDCVVLDNQMPGPSGFNLIHKLFKASIIHPPIILISCTMDRHLAENAKSLGATVCAGKWEIDLPSVVDQVLKMAG